MVKHPLIFLEENGGIEMTGSSIIMLDKDVPNKIASGNSAWNRDKWKK
jgi:hypothetical protein